MKRILATAALALVAGISLAQGPGPGAGPGKGPGGGWQFGPNNTRGWSLMTAEEREQHRQKMLAMTTYADCKALLDEQRKLIDERAKERGVAAPRGPRTDMCERMKARGRIS
jgi:Spy/CpxP family protein refolding chaperone